MWGVTLVTMVTKKEKDTDFTLEILTYFGLLQLLHYENKYLYSSVFLHRVSFHTTTNC